MIGIIECRLPCLTVEGSVLEQYTANKEAMKVVILGRTVIRHRSE